jgi:protein-tyrosine-phosphatase
MTKRVFLFVCTGNTCRSPLAEGLLRHALGARQDILVKSAGVAAGNGQSANPQTLSVLEEVGVDLSSHRSQSVYSKLLADAEWIVAMTNDHRDVLLSLFPEVADRTNLLCDFIPGQEGQDVPDPIGMGRDAYLHTRDVIVDAIPGILARIGKAEA